MSTYFKYIQNSNLTWLMIIALLFYLIAEVFYVLIFRFLARYDIVA